MADWKTRAADLTADELQADETYEAIREAAVGEEWDAMKLGGVCRALKKRAKAVGDSDLAEETAERTDELKAAVAADLAKAAARARKDERVAVAAANGQLRAANDGALMETKNFPDEVLAKMPETYAVAPDGVKLIADGAETVICGTPIVPVMKYSNAQDKKTYYKLRYLVRGEDGKQKVAEKTVPAAMLASKNKILGLSDYDVLINSNNAAAMVQYFDRLICAAPIPIGRSTQKLGWDENWNFAPYDMDTHYDGPERIIFEQLLDVKGEQETFFQRMRELREKRDLALSVPIATAMAAPLVKFVGGILPSIVHIYGGTGKGKSLAVTVALSQYGAAEKGGLMSNYTGTVPGAETRLDFLTNLPICMDDTSNKRDEFRAPEKFQAFVYSICDGQGRPRARKDQDTGEIVAARTKTWQTIILSTGEELATTGFTQGGGLSRVFELRVGGAPLFEDTDEVVDFFSGCHGHAIRPFLAKIKELGRDGVRAIYKKYKGDLEKKLGSLGLLKQIQPIALILTADKILADYIYGDQVYLWDQVDELAKSMKSTDDISDGLRGYEYLQDWITTHPKNMEMDRPKDDIRGDQAGFFGKGGHTAYITKNKLAEIMAGGGYKVDTLINWLETHGLTTRDKNGRINKVVYVREGYRARMVEIVLPNLEGEQLDAESQARADEEARAAAEKTRAENAAAAQRTEFAEAWRRNRDREKNTLACNLERHNAYMTQKAAEAAKQAGSGTAATQAELPI